MAHCWPQPRRCRRRRQPASLCRKSRCGGEVGNSRAKSSRHKQGERSQQQNNKQTAQQRRPGASRRTSSQSYTHMLIEFCYSPLWSPVRCVSPNESISDIVCRCICTHLVGGRPCSCTRAGGSFGSTPCPLSRSRMNQISASQWRWMKRITSTCGRERIKWQDERRVVR